MIKVLAFDLDDTLFDARDYFSSAFELISEWVEEQYSIEKKLVLNALYTVLEKRGSTYKKLFNEAFSKVGLNNSKAVSKAVKLFHTIPLNQLRPYPDASVLEKLGKKHRIVILTQGSKIKQERKIKWFKIDVFADFVLYAQDLGYLKPDPRLYEELLKKCKCKPDEVLVIGDNPFLDFPGAKLAGLKTARILRGEFQNMPDVVPPDFCFNSLTDLNRSLSRFEEK